MNPAIANNAFAPLHDSRECRRVDLDVSVDLESDHNFYTGLTQNIGSGGLFVATNALRSVGDRLTLRFTLPSDERPLTVDAEVRWIRENSALHRREGATGMGLQFVGLTPETAAAIRKFMQDRESLYHDEE